MKMQMLAGWLTGLLVVGGMRSMVDAPIVMAKSTEEQTANQVYSRANPAVVIIRSGDRSHGSGFMVSAGELVGVNTAVAVVPVICQGGQYCGQSLGNVGIGYAIGVDVVKKFLSNIERGNISPVSTLPK